MAEYKLVRCSDGVEVSRFSMADVGELLLSFVGGRVKRRVLRTEEFVTSYPAIRDAFRLTNGSDFGYNP